MKPTTDRPRLRLYRPPLDEAQRRAVARLIEEIVRRRLPPEKVARLGQHLGDDDHRPHPAA